MADNIFFLCLQMSDPSVDLRQELLAMRKQFDCKRQIIAALDEEMNNQTKIWRNRVYHNSLLTSAITFAISNRSTREFAKNAFERGFERVIVKQLDPLLSAGSVDWRALESLKSKIKCESDLNVADPVWVFFLKTFHALVVLESSADDIGVCRRLLQSITRWTPDEGSLTPQAKEGLKMFCSPSDIASQIKG